MARLPKSLPPIVAKISARCAVLEGVENFRPLAESCDVAIAWGLPDLSALHGYRESGGRVVFVGHGHCDWSVRCIQSAMPQITDWTAVSRHAAESFPEATARLVSEHYTAAAMCRRWSDFLLSLVGAKP